MGDKNKAPRWLKRRCDEENAWSRGRFSKARGRLGLSAAVMLGWPSLALAQQAEDGSAQVYLASADVDDLTALSIEELAQIPVQSASKRVEPLSSAPAAIYVISGEEIAAAAANSLPEALRLAANVQVQQVNAHEFAISARGFNSVEASNKLLVLIDGRTIYTPLHHSVGAGQAPGTRTRRPCKALLVEDEFLIAIGTRRAPRRRRL